MRNKPSLQDISNKLDDFSILINDLAALSCDTCSCDLNATDDIVFCKECVEADRDQIEELKNEVKARAEAANALEKENKELREKLERADWSDKMDLLHEWAIDYQAWLWMRDDRNSWMDSYNKLYLRHIRLLEGVTAAIDNNK